MGALRLSPGLPSIVRSRMIRVTRADSHQQASGKEANREGVGPRHPDDSEDADGDGHDRNVTQQVTTHDELRCYLHN